MTYCLNCSGPTFTRTSNRIPYRPDIFTLSIYRNACKEVDDDCFRHQKVQDPASKCGGGTRSCLVSINNLCELNYTEGHSILGARIANACISVTYKSLNIRTMKATRPLIPVRAPGQSLDTSALHTEDFLVPNGSAMNSHSIAFTFKTSLR
jgi:hypothetical protein